MKSTVRNWIKILKKYEQNHPVLIIVWSALISLLIVSFAVGSVVAFHHFSYTDKQYVQFHDKTFAGVIRELYGRDDFTGSELQDVSSLVITDNSELTNISDLKYFKNLKELTIHNCAIEDISVLSELQYLKKVDLSDNNIVDLSVFEECPQLEELVIDDNQIKDLTPLSAAYNLKSLSVAGNNISEIPLEIQSLKMLNQLDISRNRLINIDNLSDLKNLIELNVASNKISQTPDLTGLDSVQVLNMADNALEYLGYMGTFDQLQELSLSDNYVSALDVLEGCPNLIKLNISYNQFTSLDGILVCEGLEHIDLRGTNISDIGLLEKLPNFNTIYVDDNFDRTKLDFMIGNFRNGDIKTKQYLLEKQYNL